MHSLSDKIFLTRVDGLDIVAPVAIDHCMTMNAQFLAVVTGISKMVVVELASSVSGYANFLLCKERAGIEGAVLSNTFAMDAFGSGLFVKFVKLVAAGSETIAEMAGQMLAKIVPDIEKTSRLVQDVSTASMEQTTGAFEVNKAIHQLDSVVQQNAAASEELAATAVELSAQAEQLQENVAFFKVA